MSVWVKVIPDPRNGAKSSLDGDVTQAKPGSMVGTALAGQPIGARCESWGIWYERVEPPRREPLV